jgi:hypothetical protein
MSIVLYFNQLQMLIPVYQVSEDQTVEALIETDARLQSKTQANM